MDGELLKCISRNRKRLQMVNSQTHWIKALIMISVLLFFAGYATTYEKRSVWSGFGYEDEKLAEDSYKVTFFARPGTDCQTVLALWHRRAAELCRHSGYQHDAIYSDKQRRASAFVMYHDIFVE